MLRRAAALSSLLAAAAVPAQPAAPAAPASAASAAPAASAADKTPSNMRVIEDDNVRIEESRARGQVQRITVRDKLGHTRGYEIIVPAGGRDPSADKGAAGQRAWQLFQF